jgi:hypothetical protein
VVDLRSGAGHHDLGAYWISTTRSWPLSVRWKLRAPSTRSVAVWPWPSMVLPGRLSVSSSSFRQALPSACSPARDLGYSIPADPMSFVGGAVEIRRATKIDAASGDLWRERTRARWAQGELWVVSRQGLVLLKRLRGSGPDRDDVKRLAGDGAAAPWELDEAAVSSDRCRPWATSARPRRHGR